MGKRISLFLIMFCLFALASVSAKDKFTVVIDPGHGGKDVGAVGAISNEKSINLNIALALGNLIERNLSDVRVIYTRKTDVFISLKGRAEIANRAKADLFISVHTNSVPPTKTPPQGFQVYTLGMHRAKDNLDVAMRENSVISLEKGYEKTYQGFDPNSSESYIMFEILQSANMEKSVELARLIQRSVCSKASRNDKGVHQAGFLVLRETSMPSCLIELGFITSNEEEQFLNSSRGIDLMARGIYEAFVEYKNIYDGKVTIPYRPSTKNQLPIENVLGRLSNNAKTPAEQVEMPKRIKVVTQPRTTQTPTVKHQRNREERHTSLDEASASIPLFKIQIFAINRELSFDSELFKGYKNISFEVDGNLHKYMIGANEDYYEILRLKEELKQEFPEAFVVAFKNGQRVNTGEAVKEFVKNKRKAM
ncbi:N-acetylmuramoyl-L-alanine amidase [Prevotella intermedia]|uniref:N-acetylmuramoyl-L-alanine amidase n=1 Tax=Prevotella intermedia TaxID=28131 RepID=A0A2D3LPF9_PREIN|nr:N-acetylmuramoyl-L-alanine amidase [Prevotella intermedia]ATV26752.1 N-acetylmuramoyl-L-alanine amidase [Prevotella intermedia]ATV32453.1 N-acetylmuramoyl-L-alanine amidase [Prevotella intermedia]ATV41136.1 N-acetylmuramoyl-L-alanine amidase [Prevotella intermedia]